jgi:hypothetical protein
VPDIPPLKMSLDPSSIEIIPPRGKSMVTLAGTVQFVLSVVVTDPNVRVTGLLTPSKGQEFHVRD